MSFLEIEKFVEKHEKFWDRKVKISKKRKNVFYTWLYQEPLLQWESRPENDSQKMS